MLTILHMTPADVAEHARLMATITRSPAEGRQGGTPCIGGTRIPVATLTRYADELGDDAALEAYPSVTRDDLTEARWFRGDR